MLLVSTPNDNTVSEQVHAMVSNAHGDLEFVRARLAENPTLANAAWDWGDGDWESALGAAGHMGRRDIAELLLAHGARLDLFVAAMLRGAFPAFPNDRDDDFNSCKYCPVNHSCRTKHDEAERYAVTRMNDPRTLLERLP